MQEPTLFMLLIGASSPGRHTEQHDIFFSVGITDFWPETEKGLHVDAWREVTCVDGYGIRIALK